MDDAICVDLILTKLETCGVDPVWTHRGVGDGSANGGFPWRGEFLPPMQRPTAAAVATAKAKAAAEAAAAAAVVANGRRARGTAAAKGGAGAADAKANVTAGAGGGADAEAGAAAARKRHPPLRLTRRWSLAKWSEFLQNAPVLRYAVMPCRRQQ